MTRRRGITLVHTARRSGLPFEVFDTRAPRLCPFCGALAVVPLPPALLAAQPDDTTHVCLPIKPFGGCNQGFAIDEPEEIQR